MTNISKTLQELVENGTERNPLPYKKGNSIFIGKCTVRKTKKGYIVFEAGKQVQMFNTLHGALAMVKCITKKDPSTNVSYLDQMYSKHEEDISFFRHVIEKTNSQNRKEYLEDRLDDSEHRRRLYKNRLEKIIFN